MRNQKTEEVEKMFKTKKGQSTLEYVLIFTAIIAGIIFVANTYMKTRTEESITGVAQKMEDRR